MRIRKPYSRKTKLIFWAILTILWASLIFILSHQPGSGAVWTPPLWYVLERKSAHVFEYAVLTFFLFRFMRVLFHREKLLPVLSLVSVAALSYGVTDELHQFFVFGRGAKLTDVAVDAIGIVLMGVLIFIFTRDKMKVGDLPKIARR